MEVEFKEKSVTTMSVDYDQDTNIGRNDRSAIKGLNSLWKRIPVDSACDNVIDLVTQIQHCKQYEPNGDWNSVSGISSLYNSSPVTRSKPQQIAT